MARVCKPNIMGIDGPVTSASKMAARYSRRRMVTANREVTIDFPTPPFPLTTPITCLMWDCALAGANKLSSLRSPQSALQLEQSCVHSLIFFIDSAF